MKKQKKQMVVYLLSRNDLKTMTHGKECAQAHHAGVQLFAKYGAHSDVKTYVKQGIKEGADHFNTTITLHATGRKIRNIIAKAKKKGYVADLLIDPTYPYLIKRLPEGPEGFYTQFIKTKSEMTFGWLLGDKNDPKFTNLVKGLELKSHNTLIYEELG